jgi:hypothetical protein
MAVYIDNAKIPYGRMKMCHMLADTERELLDMADHIGVDRKWIRRGSIVHFDVCLSKRQLAINAGAIEINNQQLVRLMRRLRQEDTNE